MTLGKLPFSIAYHLIALVHTTRIADGAMEPVSPDLFAVYESERLATGVYDGSASFLLSPMQPISSHSFALPSSQGAGRWSMPFPCRITPSSASISTLLSCRAKLPRMVRSTVARKRGCGERLPCCRLCFWLLLAGGFEAPRSSLLADHSAGERVFHIIVEGQPFLPYFDVFRNFGFRKPGVVSFEMQVTDNTLNILFSRVRKQPKINGISIEFLA